MVTIENSTNFTLSKWYFIAVVWNEETDDLYLYVGDEDNAPTQDKNNTNWTNSVSTVGVTEKRALAKLQPKFKSDILLFHVARVSIHQGALFTHSTDGQLAFEAVCEQCVDSEDAENTTKESGNNEPFVEHCENKPIYPEGQNLIDEHEQRHAVPLPEDECHCDDGQEEGDDDGK